MIESYFKELLSDQILSPFDSYSCYLQDPLATNEHSFI